MFSQTRTQSTSSIFSELKVCGVSRMLETPEPILSERDISFGKTVESFYYDESKSSES